MVYSFSRQFSNIVERASVRARAHLCEGDHGSAVVWSPSSEITIRLSLRSDEIWLLAGAGLLIRFVAASDGDFDHENIDVVIDTVLAGEAIEHFNQSERGTTAIPVGYRLGNGTSFSGGVEANSSLFEASIAGPLESGRGGF